MACSTLLPENIMPHVKNTEALLLLLEKVQVQHKRTKCRLKLEMLTGNQEDVSSQLNTITIIIISPGLGRDAALEKHPLEDEESN